MPRSAAGHVNHGSSKGRGVKGVHSPTYSLAVASERAAILTWSTRTGRSPWTRQDRIRRIAGRGSRSWGACSSPTPAASTPRCWPSRPRGARRPLQGGPGNLGHLPRGARSSTPERSQATLGFNLIEVETYELADPRFAQNTPERCYHCKTELFGLLQHVAEVQRARARRRRQQRRRPGRLPPGFPREGRVRRGQPASRGRHDQGRHPRRRPRARRCPTGTSRRWPASPRASPTARPITESALETVRRRRDRARALGLAQFRVRAHGEVARLEVAPERWTRRGRCATRSPHACAKPDSRGSRRTSTATARARSTRSYLRTSRTR